MSNSFINRPGIVEGVVAKRKDKDVKYLTVTVRFETELAGVYYGESNKVDEIAFSVAADSGVNPGDVVVMSMDIKSPFGQRFQPALTISDEPQDQVTEADDPIDILIDAVNDVEDE